MILNNLVVDEEYARKVLPFLKEEYFEDAKDRVAWNLISDFYNKYNTAPTLESLFIDLSNKSGINDSIRENVSSFIGGIKREDTNKQWLLDTTESFCKDRAFHNGLYQCIALIEKKDASKDSAVKIMQDALAVSFDTRVGHEYFEDYKDRFEYYHKVEEKIKFDIDLLNKVTHGGAEKKTLNIVQGGTGVGKSMILCHFTASWLLAGYDVMYLTAELSEENVSKRIDANLLDIPMNVLQDIPWDNYEAKMNKLRAKTQGRLIVREIPTAGSNVNHYRFILQEARLKKNFSPRIIVVDQLNNCGSVRYKGAVSMNQFHLVMQFATEELRSLAQEFDASLWTAQQLNRSGHASNDPDLTSVASSFNSAWAADFTLAVVSTEELEQLNQLLMKQTGKNRYNDSHMDVRFVVGFDRQHMRLYNVEQAAQENIVNGPTQDDDKPVLSKQKFDKSLFHGFK